jgi:predicted transcriptional regulator
MEEDKNEGRKILIGVKVSPEVKEKIENLASKEDRTLSAMAFRLLRTHPLLQKTTLTNEQLAKHAARAESV